MLNDRKVWDEAMSYVDRSRNTAGNTELANALMHTAALLLIVFELRRLNNRLDDSEGR